MDTLQWLAAFRFLKWWDWSLERVTTGWIENVLAEFAKVHLRSNQVLAKSLVSSKKEI